MNYKVGDIVEIIGYAGKYSEELDRFIGVKASITDIETEGLIKTYRIADRYWQEGDFKKVNENVNHPNHYTAGKIEVIDFLESQLPAMNIDGFEGYVLGNIYKYISRFPMKNGIEDLEKAEFYLKKLISYQKNLDK